MSVPSTPDAAPASHPRPLAIAVYGIAVVGGIALAVVPFARILEPSDFVVVALAGALIQAAILLLVGRILLPRRRAAPTTIALSILIGATFSVGAALQLVGLTGSLERLVVTPVIEEAVKTIAIVVVLWMLRSRFRGPLDGLAVGFFVGFGFAVAENVLYTANAADLANAWQLVIARGITQVGGHVVFSGIIGAGFAAVMVGGMRRWWPPVVAIALGLGVHLLWDVPALVLGSIAYLGAVLVLTALAIVLFVQVRRWCSRVEEREASAGIANAAVDVGQRTDLRS